MGLLDFIFGNNDKKIKQYLKKGAIILDVRTPEEFQNGAIENAVNIPLQELHERVEEVKALNKPLIVCCQSGIRSAKATKFLALQNIDAINGGGWKSLHSKL